MRKVLIGVIGLLLVFFLASAALAALQTQLSTDGNFELSLIKARVRGEVDREWGPWPFPVAHQGRLAGHDPQGFQDNPSSHQAWTRTLPGRFRADRQGFV